MKSFVQSVNCMVFRKGNSLSHTAPTKVNKTEQKLQIIWLRTCRFTSKIINQLNIICQQQHKNVVSTSVAAAMGFTVHDKYFLS